MTTGTATVEMGAVPLFADLSPAELQELSWLVSPFAYAPGERIFRQGEPGDALYCVEAGRVALSVRLPGGDDLPVSEVGPGELLGEMAMLDAGPRSATATALEPTTGYALSAQGFAVLRAALRPSGYKVLRRLASVLTARLRAHARDFAAGDPVRLPDAVKGRAPHGGAEDVPLGLRSPAGALEGLDLTLLPPFRRFSGDELEELLRRVRVAAVPRGRVLFREGDAARSCFVVVRGAVVVCVQRGGDQRKLAVEGPGAMLGHFALVSPGVRSATCVTREPSILLEIDRATFDDMFESTSAAAFKFLSAVTELLSGERRRTNHRRGIVTPSTSPGRPARGPEPAGGNAEVYLPIAG